MNSIKPSYLYIEVKTHLRHRQWYAVMSQGVFQAHAFLIGCFFSVEASDVQPLSLGNRVMTFPISSKIWGAVRISSRISWYLILMYDSRRWIGGRGVDISSMRGQFSKMVFKRPAAGGIMSSLSDSFSFFNY